MVRAGRPPVRSRPASRRGRRAGLTRSRVIEAAVELIDREGLEDFSLRRLAACLGVEPMSLYNHVRSKDDLFDGVVEAVMAEMAASDDPKGRWDERMRSRAAALRRVALAHPYASILVFTRPVLTPAALSVLRAGLAPALEAGLPTEQAVHALRTFTSFISGAILRELGSGMTFATSDPKRAAQRVDEIESAGDTILAEAAPYLAACDHDALFDYGVELILDGLSRQIAGSRAARAKRAPAGRR